MADMTIGEIVHVKDEIELVLEHVRYHETIGVDYFLICDRGSADATVEQLEELAKKDNVYLFKQNIYLLHTHSPAFKNRRIDTFRKIIEVFSPDWIFAGDADEFWVPRQGNLRKTKLLTEADLLTVQRFNAAFDEQSGADFLKRPVEPDKIFEQEVIAKPTPLSPRKMAENPNLAWIMAKVVNRFFTRLKNIDGITPGFHDIKTNQDIVRATPDDLLVLHVPFTSRDRFKCKVMNMHEHIRHVGHTFSNKQAWHWKRWVKEIRDEETLDKEFHSQFFSASELARLRKEKVVRSIQSHFESV